LGRFSFACSVYSQKLYCGFQTENTGILLFDLDQEKLADSINSGKIHEILGFLTVHSGFFEKSSL